MDRILPLRIAALYLPLVAALAAGFVKRPPPRQFAACLLSLLWTLPALLLLQRLNQLAQWWSFAATSPQLAGMPLELYLGWIILWGALPQLALPRLPLWSCAALMAALDRLAMPRFAPLILLSPHWLPGEAAAIVLVLLPALAIARWTVEDTHLPLRAALQAAIAALLFLYLAPEIVFALRPGRAWQSLLQMAPWQRPLWLQIVFLCAIPGLSAVMEFAQRGGGTPIPYDPPRRLVVSGIYRYVANPMQLSCAVVMLLWAAILRNAWLLIPALVSIVYSAGIADWDEAADLAERFGQPWRAYRGQVRNWLPRWRPYHAGPPARLYIAATCGPCTEVRAWIGARSPIGLEIVDAEMLPPRSIRRIRYQPGETAGAVEGVRAVARALEHLNLVYAMAGAALRLPGVWQFVQLAMDAGGLGPRDIPSTCTGVIRPS
jgi:protein-S-isoprenylcysteine O-methyltransferase Ste14